MTLTPVTSPIEEVQRGRFLSAVDSFLASHDVAASSRATYRRQLLTFTRWLSGTGRLDSDLSGLTREDILEYKNWLLGSFAAHTVSGYLVAVRRLFAWFEAQRLFPNIARDIKGAKKPRTFTRDCLTVGQIREALSSLKGSSLQELRDYALVNLLVRTGLRTIEVSRATVADLRQEGGQAVLWIQGKGRDSKDDFVLLLEDTLQPIREYLAARGTVSEHAPLFESISDRNAGGSLTPRSISRIVKTTLRGIGLDDRRLTAHSLRHSAVTLAIQGGATLQQAQAMARHSDPKTTLVYFHNLDRVAQGAERYIQI